MHTTTHKDNTLLSLVSNALIVAIRILHMLYAHTKTEKVLLYFSNDPAKALMKLNKTGTSTFCNHPGFPAITIKRKLFHFSNKAFTLLELMIVIAIISVLATIAIPHFKRYIERTERTALIQTMRMLEREITLFQLSNGRYPDDLDELGLGTLEDPWGNPFRYLNIADADGKFTGKNKPRKDHSLHPVNTDYDLYSMGPDGKTNIPFTAKASRDDFVRANNGSFLGNVSDY